MANLEEGSRVRVVTREVTDEDRKANRYYDHMAGLTGTVQNIYGEDEIAVKIDPEAMSPVTKDVHKIAVERMREKFLNNVSEEQKKTLTPEELKFNANFVLLFRKVDLEILGA